MVPKRGGCYAAGMLFGDAGFYNKECDYGQEDVHDSCE